MNKDYSIRAKGKYIEINDHPVYVGDLLNIVDELKDTDCLTKAVLIHDTQLRRILELTGIIKTNIRGSSCPGNNFDEFVKNLEAVLEEVSEPSLETCYVLWRWTYGRFDKVVGVFRTEDQARRAADDLSCSVYDDHTTGFEIEPSQMIGWEQ